MAKQLKRAVDLVLDPGAFSAWRRNEEIGLKQYIKFVLRHEGCFDHVCALDVIPGRPGQTRTPQMTEDAAQQSFNNAIRMRKEGLNVVPVYHMGERRYWLDKLLGEGFSYIGLGGFAKSHGDARQDWLDQTFGYLCGHRGYPAVKLHGFGMTSLPLIFRYPWHTVDSMSWVLMGSYGWVLVPRLYEGKLDYTRGWFQIGYSSGNKKSGGMHADVLRSGNHITLVSDEVRKHVNGWLESEGFDPAKLLTDHDARTRVNCRFFLRAEQSHKPRPFRWRRHGLFCESPDVKQGVHKPVAPFKLLFTINPTAQLSNLLADEGIRNRLLSFYWFKDKDPWSLHDYVKTGRLNGKSANGKKVKRGQAV